MKIIIESAMSKGAHSLLVDPLCKKITLLLPEDKNLTYNYLPAFSIIPWGMGIYYIFLSNLST